MKRGVLLFNLGGPEKLQDVRPFLYNLFSNPEIIRIRSAMLRKLLAWLVATLREKKSQGLYRQIGGGSPLGRITKAQAAALSNKLNSLGLPTAVYVGMYCWRPSIDEAVTQIMQDGVTQLVLLPLFPQYSVTTTGSCLKHFQAVSENLGLNACTEISTVEKWYDEPLYVESMTDMIEEGLAQFSLKGSDPVHLLYSAHSIPSRYIAEGDPYLQQIEESVQLINSKLGNVCPSTLAFQSKLGPVKWLGPSTKDVLAQMGRSGIQRVLAIPVSFVSNHLETLQEIDIVYREFAIKCGIKEFHRAASLNLHPKFIDALAHVVLQTGRF